MPHPLIPTRTIDALGAKIRVVSTDEALRIGRGGSGVLGPLELTADRGLLGPARDIERLEGFPTSIALYLIDVPSAVVILALRSEMGLTALAVAVNVRFCSRAATTASKRFGDRP